MVIDGLSLLYSFFRSRTMYLEQTFDTNYIVTEINIILDNLEQCNLSVIKVFFSTVKNTERIPILVTRRKERNAKSRKFWRNSLLNGLITVIY